MTTQSRITFTPDSEKPSEDSIRLLSLILKGQWNKSKIMSFTKLLKSLKKNIKRPIKIRLTHKLLGFVMVTSIFYL